MTSNVYFGYLLLLQYSARTTNVKPNHKEPRAKSQSKKIFLVALETWCEYNLMRLNLGKCKCMYFFRKPRITPSYSLIGSRLEFVNSFVDLGILMDPKLNFINHINGTISKARSSLGFVKRW